MPEHRPISKLGLYRAGITDSRQRRAITVGRDAVLQDTLEILRRGIGKKPKHHLLFIGPRGIGKTHLLSLFEDSVHEDPALNSAWHVVRFPEESHRVLSFCDFLLRLCEILRDTLPEERCWADLLQRLADEDSDQTIVDTLIPAIRARRQSQRQSLIIMLENLNQILDDQFRDPRHAASLRGFFLDNNGCLLIATAPLHSESVADHKQPFFDFFDVQFLDQLTEQQTFDLIKRNLTWEQRDDLLADFDNLQPRLQALYRMTGGSPRLTLMLYELIAHDAVSEVKRQFEILLDRITPFYQDRMRELGPQESALLETMATMRDQDKTPSSIAAQMRMPPTQVSSLLKRLSKSQYLTSTAHPTDGRARLYAIREGFFDIWLAMNISRGVRKRMPFLIEFFAEFYPTIQARNRKREEYRQRLATGDTPAHEVTPSRSDLLDGLDLLSEVGTGEERASEKIKLAALHANDSSKAREYLRETRSIPLEGMGQWIISRTPDEPDYDYLKDMEEMISCWDTWRSGNLESFAARMKATGASLSWHSWSETRVSFLQDHLSLLPPGRERIEIRLQLGNFLKTLARWQDAETQLRAAVLEAAELADSELLNSSQNSLGELLVRTNHFVEAESILRQSDFIAQQTFGPDHPEVARCLNNLANLLRDTNRPSEAEPLYRRSLAISESSYGPNHPQVAIRLNNLAELLRATNRLSEAAPLYRRALKIDEASYGPDHPEVAIRLNNLAELLCATNRMSEAEPLYRRALAIDEANYGPDHPEVAIDLNNLASLLEATNRLPEAEQMYRRSLAIAEVSYGPRHTVVATCLNNLANLFRVTNRLWEAEPLYRRALAILESSYGPDHPQVAICLNNLALLLCGTDRLTDAEPLSRRAVSILVRFQAETGHEHPRFAGVVNTYKRLLGEQGLDAALMESLLRSVLKPSNPDAP